MEDPLSLSRSNFTLVISSFFFFLNSDIVVFEPLLDGLEAMNNSIILLFLFFFTLKLFSER